jgi:hypothetical protein
MLGIRQKEQVYNFLIKELYFKWNLVKLNVQPFEGLVLPVMSEVGEDKEL